MHLLNRGHDAMDDPGTLRPLEIIDYDDVPGHARPIEEWQYTMRPEDTVEAVDHLEYLSPREIVILKLSGSGESQRDVAQKMGITQGAVAHQLARIKLKIKWNQARPGRFSLERVEAALQGFRGKPGTAEFVLEFLIGTGYAQIAKRHETSYSKVRHSIVKAARFTAESDPGLHQALQDRMEHAARLYGSFLPPCGSERRKAIAAGQKRRWSKDFSKERGA